MCDLILKHRRIFNFLFGVWKRGQTRSFVFNVIYQTRETVFHRDIQIPKEIKKYDAQRSIRELKQQRQRRRRRRQVKNEIILYQLNSRLS